MVDGLMDDDEGGGDTEETEMREDRNLFKSHLVQNSRQPEGREECGQLAAGAGLIC